jgi:TatD DNase family protein
MILVDTHAHLYLSEFDTDRSEAVKRATEAGISTILLPNIDTSSLAGMYQLCDTFQHNCLPMIGLHPTSVKADYHEELNTLRQELQKRKFVAIGEAGIDLYWDKTYYKEQVDALRQQISWAREFNLPLVIHSRNSMEEIIEVFENEGVAGLRGVFHCYSGNLEQARKITGWGFFLGIGGVVTYKKSGLDAIVSEIPTDYLLLETDAPFLSPVPYRGKRNESTYLIEIAEKIAQIKGIDLPHVASVTTANACKLFNITINQ